MEDFLTISELNNFIRDVLNSGFPQSLWICGEVQELRDKKHLYFTLSEKDPESNAIIAKIGATIWSNVRPKIEGVLQKAENAFVLKDDIEVKLLCKVDFYPPFGQVRLIVEAIDPTYTLGKIAQDRQKLIALLKQKGLLEKNKQLSLPLLPLNIGLITSYNSAAYHDFVDELRKSGYAFNVWIADAIMQGKSTEQSVASSIKLFNRMKGVDVVVITRGGGSVAELSCFDSYIIAEIIAGSKIPVISGIGHEINTTVTDLSAHTFAKTPTAVAGFLINCIEDFLKGIEDRKETLFQRLEELLQERSHHLKSQAVTLSQTTVQMLKAQQNNIARMTETFRRLPLSLLKESKNKTQQYKENLKKTIHLRLSTSRNKIQGYQKLLDVADPVNMLKKGFSITRDDKGKVVKSIRGFKSKVLLKTQLGDGVVTSEVKGMKKGTYEY